MDQLKPYLAALKKNQFWILSAIVVVTALIVWNSASAEVKDKFDKDKGTNERAFQSLNMFNNRQMNKLPNPEFKKRVDADRETLEAGVMKAWQALFDKQIEVFPVNKRVPELEKYLVDPKYFEASIPVQILEVYRNNALVEEDFKNLFEILDLRRPKGTNPVDGARGEGAVVPEGLVVWKAEPSPQGLMARYRTNPNAPSEKRIRMQHEDMWVFRSMFTVIQRINSKPIDVWLQILDGGAPSESPVDQANLPIKQINYCDLAQYAMSSAELYPGEVELAGDSSAGAVGGPKNEGPYIAKSGFSVGTIGNIEEDAKLALGRYIDGRNMPVEDPTNPPFKEFKQMFVQMQLVMDQRLIPVLIAECANAPIIIETRQVLVDLSEVDVPKTVNAGEAARVVDKIEPSPHDVYVTLRGVVFGYSPPKIENLGKGTDPDPSKRDYGIAKKLPKE